MAFWKTVKRDLKKAVEEGWTVVKDGAKVAAEKSEEVAKTGKLKYKAHILQKDAEKLFADLGGIIYDLANGRSEKNPFSNPEVKRLVKEIAQLEDSAGNLEDDITKIKKHMAKSSPKKTKPKASAAPKKAAPKKAVKKKAAPKKAVPKKAAPKKAAPAKPKAAPAKKPQSKKKA